MMAQNHHKKHCSISEESQKKSAKKKPHYCGSLNGLLSNAK
jgi:hypothetical protein